MTTFSADVRTAVAGLTLMLATGCQRHPLAVDQLSVPALDEFRVSSDAGLAISLNGQVSLSWIGGDSVSEALYVARSSDSGHTWSAAVRIAGGPQMPGEVHPHGESSPRLVAGLDSTLAVTWANSITVSTRKWPAAMMRFSRSSDGGRTWSAPITLNDDTTGSPVSHQFHGAAWSGDSGLVVAWLDERATGGVRASPDPRSADPHAHDASEPDAAIYVASSPDFGRSWGPNQLRWGAVCPCCRVSLARGRNGRVLSAWRKHYPGDVRDVVVAGLDEDSSAVRRVHADDWVYPGCPHAGPALSVNASGAHVVWYTGKQGAAGVFYSRMDDSSHAALALLERPTLPPAHVAVAALPDGGALAAYDIDASGARVVTLVRIAPDGSVRARRRVRGSEQGTYPQLVPLGDDVALLGWTSTGEDGSRVRVARVRIANR